MTDPVPQSKGNMRVRVGFNPSEDRMVRRLKGMAADMINEIEGISAMRDVDGVPTSQGEIIRLKALAQTSIEEGAMWAVKAATAD